MTPQGRAARPLIRFAAALASLCLLAVPASAAVITAITAESEKREVDPVQVEAAKALLDIAAGGEILFTYQASAWFGTDPETGTAVGAWSREEIAIHLAGSRSPIAAYALTLLSHTPCPERDPEACPSPGFPAHDQLVSEAGFSFAPDSLAAFYAAYPTLWVGPAFGGLTGDIDLARALTRPGAVPIENALDVLGVEQWWSFGGSTFDLRVAFAPMPLPASGLLFLSGPGVLAARRSGRRRSWGPGQANRGTSRSSCRTGQRS